MVTTHVVIVTLAVSLVAGPLVVAVAAPALVVALVEVPALVVALVVAPVVVALVMAPALVVALVVAPTVVAAVLQMLTKHFRRLQPSLLPLPEYVLQL
ncbi:hypothetical protein AaE_003440 [Aphanomyces astaci]|uniref:Uncharacterized protein n=1 Tax=Aphanomyces astaci TaxID=112090 RepID=A0A397EZU5_APHAT|nr:hypothetical protein AaE_003440 [Aphanomyces astaci]RHZ10233.1 hypothetical protein DYB31_009497 [Aphanomyces astaci]